MRHPLLLLVLLLVAGWAVADQQAWITRAEADRAAAILPVGASIRLYCAPCDDPAPTSVRVARVDVVTTGYHDLWEVQINGEGIDLAYTYVLSDGRWQDLALLLGLEAEGVPRFLVDGASGPAAAAPAPAEELATAEEELAGLVDALVGSLPPAAAKQLVQSQDAWGGYRDAQVRLETSLDADPGVGTAARLRVVRGRIAELERLR